jgi:Tol biopolymer transport system component
MSSPTQPMTDPGRSAAAFASELARDEQTWAIDVSRATPPREVLEQMAAADSIRQELLEDGREIAFTSDAGERLGAIELRGLDGDPIRTLTAAQAVGIAVGGPVE